MKWSGTITCDVNDLSERLNYMFSTWVVSTTMGIDKDVGIQLLQLAANPKVRPWMASQVLIKYQGVN